MARCQNRPLRPGEAGYWRETLVDRDITRLMGQLGIRTSLPMARVDPTVTNELFNVNGIAHKIVYESDFYWADADYNLDDLPLYDPLDDDAIEFYRRRFFLIRSAEWLATTFR